MKTLEELLAGFGCNGRAFDENGDFTDTGSESYNRMIGFLYDLASLTGIRTEPFIRELDKICNENY